MSSQMEPRCLCGQAMTFPKHKNVSHCKTEGCGVRWERDKSGYWAAEGFLAVMFTPIFARKKVCSVRTKGELYSNYPKSKSRRKKGKVKQ